MTSFYFSAHSYPFRTSKPGDVGHDLYAWIDEHRMAWYCRLYCRIFKVQPFIVVWPWTYQYVESGIFLLMHPNQWADIRSRSSTAKRGLMILGGVIDTGYDGELYTNIHNFGLLPRIISQGERLAQVIFFDKKDPQDSAFEPFVWLDSESFLNSRHKRREMTGGSRGDSGFGSTGI